MAGQGLIVAVRPHPFRLDRQLLEAPPGLSLAEIVELALPDPATRQHAVVALEGAVVPRADWALVPPPGSRLTVTIRPGSRELLGPLLTIAVVVAAAAAGPAGASALGITAAAGYSSAAVSATSAAITAAVGLAGTLAITALVPPAQPQLGATGRKSRAWSLEAASNDARLYSPIPRVLGRHRMTPPLAAAVVPETDGADAWLRVALCWGYGRVNLSDLRFGETPADNISGLEVQTFDGTPGATPSLSLYSDDISVDRVDALVEQAKGPVTRRSAPSADEVIVNITLPRGLVSMERGGKDSLRVQYTIEIAPVGGSWTTVVDETIFKATTTPIRRSHRIPVSGQVDVRVTRITRDRGDVAKIDDLVWSSLLSVRHTNPFAAPGVAVTALRVPAGEQAQGTLDAVNAVVESLVPDWNGTSWVNDQPSRNPAALARAVLQGNGNHRPRSDAQLDLPAFEAWHDYCSERGLTCDLIVDWDGATVEEVLSIIGACGDAVVLPIDGRWTPVIDRPQSTPVQVFTPRNMTNFRMQRVLSELPHALRVRFLDAEAGWRQAERVVYADGYDEASATRFEDLELPGVTSAALAWRHGRRRLAEARLRRELYTFEVDWEFLACRVGDRIELAHDAILAAVGAGRIRSLERDTAGNVLSLEIDQAVTLAAGVDYGCTIRRAAGISTHALAAIDITGDTTVLPLAAAIPAASAPAVGDLVVVGEAGMETMPALVTRIRPSSDLTAEVQAVPYHDGVYTADTEPIPPWSPRISISALATPPVIRSARRDQASGDLLVELGGATTVRVALAALELAWTDDPDAASSVSSWPPDTRLARLVGLPTDATIHVRARWRLITGAISAWSATVTVQPADAGGRPPDVPSAWLDGDELIWRAPAADGLAGFRVRYGHPGVTWEAATAAHDGLIVGTRWSARQLPIDRADLLVVAVGRNGLESATPARVSWQRQDDLSGWYPLTESDDAELGWPGTVSDGARTADGISGVADEALWPDPEAAAWPDPEAAAFVRGSATWAYRTTFEIPVTVTVDDAEVAVTPQDAVLVRPAIEGGAIYRIELGVIRDADQEPFADGRFFSDGRGWVRMAKLPWLAWPRAVRAEPGATIMVRLEGSGTLTNLKLQLARRVRQLLFPSIDVPVTGLDLDLPADAIRVVGVQATAHDPLRVVAATRTIGGVRIEARDLDGAPAPTTADVRVEVI